MKYYRVVRNANRLLLGGMDVLWIVSLLLPCISAFQDNKGLFMMKEEHTDATTANFLCNKTGPQWALLSGQRYTNILQSYMVKNRIQSAWLGWQKKKFPEWTWINQKPYNQSLYPNGRKLVEREGRTCAIMLQTGFIDSSNCFSRLGGVGYICEIEGPKNCPWVYNRQNCLQFENRMFYMGCHALSWYDARWFCKSGGADLAIIDSPNLVTDLQTFIMETKMHRTCKKYYIGLRHEEWYQLLPHTGNLSNSFLNKMPWDEDERLSRAECALLFLKENDQIVWRSASCKTKSAVICENYSMNQTCPEYFWERRSEIKDSENPALASTILAAFAVCAAVLLLAIFLIYNFIRKRFGRKQVQKETVPSCIKKCNLVTIVMFSSEVSKDLPNAKVENYDWPDIKVGNEHSGTEKARRIIQAFEMAMKKIHGPEKTSEKLRLINIHAVNVKGAMPRNVVKAVLDYLCKNRDTIDIICLPSFKPINQEVADVLQNLQLLRQSSVVLCPAVRTKDVPTKEVLAVGVMKGQQYVSRLSGATDFVVDISKGDHLEQSLFIGVSIVTGIFASILSLLKKEHGSDDKDLKLLKTANGMRNILIKLCQTQGEPNRFCENAYSPLWGFAKVHYTGSQLQNKENVLKVKQEILIAMKSGGQKVPAQTTNTRNATLAAIQEHKHETLDEIEKKITREETNKYRVRIVIVGKMFTIKEPHADFVEHMDGYGNKSDTGDSEIIEIITTTLSKNEGSVSSLKKWLKIISYPIMGKDWRMRWETLGKVLQKLCEEEPPIDIIYLSPTFDWPPSGYQIYRYLLDLKQKSVVVTGATLGIENNDPSLPMTFPSECVISVRTAKDETDEQKFLDVPNDAGCAIFSEPLLQNQQKPVTGGATLDFTCHGGRTTHGDKEDLATDDLAGSYYTVAIIALVLIRIQQLFDSPEEQKYFVNTTNMHKLLRGFTQSRNGHDIFQGWGLLRPWNLLKPKNEHELKKIIEDIKTTPSLWSGKNY